MGQSKKKNENDYFFVSSSLWMNVVKKGWVIPIVKKLRKSNMRNVTFEKSHFNFLLLGIFSQP